VARIIRKAARIKRSATSNTLPGYVDCSYMFKDNEIVQVHYQQRTDDAMVMVNADIRVFQKRQGGITVFYGGTLDEMIDWLQSNQVKLRHAIKKVKVKTCSGL